MARGAIGDRRYAIAAACAAPMLALVLMLTTASGLSQTMAAPPPPTSAPPPPASGTRPCFYRDHTPVCVNRLGLQAAGSTEEQARQLLQALVAGPMPAERGAGIRSALPDGAQLADVIVKDDAITIKLVLPESFLYGGLDPLASDEITEQIIKTLYPLSDLRKFTVLAQEPRDPAGAYKPLSHFLFEPPAVHKESAAPDTITGTRDTAPYHEGQAAIPIAASIQTTGALVGKAVYLSAGHGWYWAENWMDWRTQRYADSGQGLIEDMNNAEVVNQYLIQYLQSAGADVWPVRERDMNTQEIIAVHGQPGYSETGVWATSVSTGYLGLHYRFADVTSTVTATATWAFTPTVSGRYAVYVWYRPDNNRAPDAQYLVAHAGGATEVRVDQRAHGYTWRYIGTFPFAGNTSGAVMLTNHSSTSGAAVIADAVRMGGGMGTEYGDGPPASPSPSGKPRWEEAARYWAKYQGAPASVYSPPGCSTDGCRDVTARPRYAEWERESGEDSVYVSWHSNGGGARGTESYIYNGDWGGTFTPGSDHLQYWIQSALVSDIRAGWESGWPDRGLRQANLGEVRVLTTMPGVLVEIAFHDQISDALALKDPRFAQLTARAMYKGIVRYFDEKDGKTSAILPEPPQNLVVRNGGNGQVAVWWRPSPTDTVGLMGNAATGYRVYTSGDGLGWDNGATVAGTALTLTGLAPGQLVFVRVTAMNPGGESFPTPVAAARVVNSGAAPVLIVNGYERMDLWMDVIRCDTPEENCPNARIWPAQMNDSSYVIQHATAIPLPLDSAVRGAVDRGDVALGAYQIVDWIAGQEQTPAPIPKGTTEVALTSGERMTLTAFLSHGGALFISGAEVAFDLVQKVSDLAFLTGTLHAQYASDDAGAFAVSPSTSGILSGIAPFNFDNGSHGSYAVDYPDVLAPTNGSTTTLSYVGGTGGVAAVEYVNGCRRLVYLGFPFETIYPAQVRQAVMARVMSFLGACPPQSPIPVILAPSPGGFYQGLQAVSGIAGDSTQVDHVDVAVVRVAAPLEFLSSTSWVTTETWLSATGSATWFLTLPMTLADGPYAAWARAWNTTGLSSTQNAVVSFTIDTVPPTAPAPITPTGGITLFGVGITLVFTPSFDANGVAAYEVQVDGRLYTTTETAFLSNLPVGSHTWTVRAFDAAGNASGWSEVATFATDAFVMRLPIVMRNYAPSPPISQCQELVSNGGFETQDVWYSLSGVKPSYVVSPVHVGIASLLIGYTTTAGAPPYVVYSSIQQTITISLTATQTTLTFWRYPISDDTQDFEYLAIGPSPTSLSTVWTSRSDERAWVPTTFDLSAYSGTLTIRIGVYNNGLDGVTAIYLDDVSVQTCNP